VDQFGAPPGVGHATPLFHVKLDAHPGEEHGPHWHEIRNHGIGGSEAAAALGVGHDSPRQLARVKMGLEPPFSGNYQTRRGAHMEAFALAEFECATGRHVERVPWVLRHPAAHATCNLDALIEGNAVGEVKCPGDYVSSDLRRLEDGLPVAPMSTVGNYVIQCTHNMWVCGLDRAWLIVLPGTMDPVFIELRQSEPLRAAIEDAERTLWQMIQAGVEPPFRRGDMQELARVWRERHQGEMETADPALVDMLSTYDRLNAASKEAEAELKAHKARLLERATSVGAQKLRVVTPGKRRSITLVQKRPRVDLKAMEAEHGELVKRYRTKESAPEIRVF
jgi:putative phage-type endonuclease